MSTNLILTHIVEGVYNLLTTTLLAQLPHLLLFKAFIFLKNSEAIANKFADEPELTIIEYFEPKTFENFSSNSLTYFSH